ncbi:hypothetical protein GCM10023079_47580 [Streptomyces chitinivorans]
MPRCPASVPVGPVSVPVGPVSVPVGPAPACPAPVSCVPSIGLPPVGVLHDRGRVPGPAPFTPPGRVRGKAAARG